jgi:hypothetical protein
MTDTQQELLLMLAMLIAGIAKYEQDQLRKEQN